GRQSVAEWRIRGKASVLLPRGSSPLGQLRVEDLWQGFAYKNDSRHVYALAVSFLGTSVRWKQRTSGHPRGKDMVYSGKVMPEVTASRVNMAREPRSTLHLPES